MVPVDWMGVSTYHTRDAYYALYYVYCTTSMFCTVPVDEVTSVSLSTCCIIDRGTRPAPKSCLEDPNRMSSSRESLCLLVGDWRSSLLAWTKQGQGMAPIFCVAEQQRSHYFHSTLIEKYRSIQFNSLATHTNHTHTLCLRKQALWKLLRQRKVSEKDGLVPVRTVEQSFGTAILVVHHIRA